jgi:uncharacterized protein
MTEKKSLQEFPSEFPIKVMGRREGDLRATTQGIVERHAGTLAEEHVKTRTSREQLDDIYRELTACKLVLMAL